MTHITKAYMTETYSVRTPGIRPTRQRSEYLSLCLSILLCLAFANARSQVLSLDSVLTLVEQNNPMLQQADYRVKAYEEYAEGATGWMAPMVGLGTFMMPYPGQRVMEEANQGSWMVSLEQAIPNPAKQSANKRYLRSRANIASEGKAVQLNALKAEARTYYLQWLVAGKKRKVLEESEKIMDLMLKLARIRYPYNQGSLGNIYKAEARLEEVRNMMLMTDADIEANESRLKALMSLPPSHSIMIDTTTEVSFTAHQAVYDTSALRQQKSNLRQLDETIRSMRLNVEAQGLAARPDFKIRFDHMQPLGNMPSQFSAMAMISIPIAPWSSKMYKSEIRGMEHDIEAMKKEREAILLETRGMLAGMVTEIQRMETQLNNYRMRIIPALRRNYQSLMLSYEENNEQLPVVIDGWEALNMAQMEYLDKMEAYYLMIVNYEKALEK